MSQHGTPLRPPTPPKLPRDICMDPSPRHLTPSSQKSSALVTPEKNSTHCLPDWHSVFRVGLRGLDHLSQSSTEPCRVIHVTGWTSYIDSVRRKAQQMLFFLWKSWVSSTSRAAGLYTSITVWFGSATKSSQGQTAMDYEVCRETITGDDPLYCSKRGRRVFFKLIM